MGKKNDRKKQHPPPSVSQPTFSAFPAPAANHPPPSGQVSSSNSNVKAKGRAKTQGESSTAIAQTVPQLLNPPNVQGQGPVRWVYNYDHTDHLNFGFMFPVTPDSSRDFSSVTTHPVSTSLSPAQSAPTPSTLGNAFLPVVDSSGSSVGGQWQWDLTAAAPDHSQRHFVSSQQHNRPSASYHDQNTIYQNIPYRRSPQHEYPPSSSTQQSAPPEEQIWFLPPHGTTIPEEFQDSAPDSRGWLLDGSSDLSQLFAGPVSSGPLITPHYAMAAAAPLKRKRDSSSTSPPTPYPNTVSDQQQSTLCSRCKIYAKLSNFPGLCSSCLQVSFNMSPSALGTRNENLESLVLLLMPSNMEDVMVFAPPNMPRSRTWRMPPKKNDQKEYDFGTLVFQDRWTLSKQQAESTRLFGEDYAELANIAQLYQLSLPRPNKSLEASCTVLITVCELYKSFVDISDNNAAPQTISIPKLLDNIRTARITIRHAFQQLQMLAVSPSNSRDRQDWFPAFLSACIMAVTAIIFLDILIACPSPYKEQIWGASWHDRIVEMRNGGYGMLIALLRANSRGVNPLKMDCWTEAASNLFINVTPESYSPEQSSPGGGHGKKKRRRTNKADSEKAHQKSIEQEAERERNILLGINSPAALQGILALKAWHVRYHDHLKQGEDMFSKSLYMLATMKPVAGLWRIFELE